MQSEFMKQVGKSYELSERLLNGEQGIKLGEQTVDKNSFYLDPFTYTANHSRSELLNVLNLTNEIKITEVKSNFYSKEYFAPRPPSENLINLKLNLRSLNIMRDWKICLREYLTKEYSEYFKK